MIKKFQFFVLIAMGLLGAHQHLFADEPVELGKVSWNRDLAQAKAVSAKTGKPLFVQFQEVPG